MVHQQDREADTDSGFEANPGPENRHRQDCGPVSRAWANIREVLLTRVHYYDYLRWRARP